MIKHIVMFRFSENVNESDKVKAYNDFKQGILSLRSIIPEIMDIEVGNNINPGEKWDICLNGTFKNMDDVQKYSKHPEHLKIAGTLKKFLSGRSCVDYEID